MKTKIIIAAIFLFALGIAGSFDRAEEILESVSPELYQQIKSDLGGKPSEVEIANYYLSNKEYYNQMAQSYGW